MADETPETANNSASRIELNEIVDRLSSHAGVESVQILSSNGDMILPDKPEEAKLTKHLLDAATAYLESFEETPKLSMVQLRAQSGRELYVAPHEGYVLCVRKVNN